MEECYLMLKPEFISKLLITYLVNEIKNNGLEIKEAKIIKYDETSAKLHYINKKDLPFYNELVSYLTSSYSYGFIVEGNDALKKCEEIKHKLRNIDSKKMGIKTDKMRNIIHSSESSKTAINEIKIFNNLKLNSNLKFS